ncbi:MAG: serine/threonine protein kinase [Phycisphaerales bacterium]|nr:serine/threonine protein kinase [Phycisphaerales bacterium]
MYEAVDRIFDESGMPSYVALKIFHGVGKSRNSQEGTRTRRIRHKHIARVFDQGQTEDGEQYVVYELVDGLSLDSWVKHRGESVSPRQACSMIVSIAHGVQSAHNAGIVHRDLKPSNILVNRENEPVVTDFGISQTQNSYEEGKQYGTRGSLAFMAPEQYDGVNEGAMPSSDIYALGGILYWLITKHFPNGDRVEEAVEWLDNRCDGGPHRLNQWGVDARLYAVISKALSLDPADRYQSVESLAQDLEAYLDNRPIYWLDQSVATQGRLFAKRKPLVVSLVFLVFITTAASIGVWVNMSAALRQERLDAVAAVEMESLQSQLTIEQARIEDLKEKSALLRSLVETWIAVVKESDDPKDARRNLLFLHSLTIDDFVQSDPLLLTDLITKKLQVGEEYLASLKVNSGSPLQIAYWHETLGEWNRDFDLVRARVHLLSALDLVEEYGPNDDVWQARLREGLESAGN